ncbi:FAD-linked oxidase C-terminal domain-containing protein [Paenibacillus alvei]|uniref:FAD-binding oxidoreductase n=1 Tax=Paenibacillus alvei TaxID=44250 RepID=UPI0018CD86E4|nr:FAD-linked oxidase C-terminal domain-containing protein [Paenibacillus alvei]MBG9733142.1 FAD-binding protein [Paenibacillus alvei]MBG9745298.1 FAD-binding protein [Paenibacillus alvei]MCY9580547.1 FAD-binding protein [Paenibacillus alvei]MCY9585031.1 FAD-binding protein [Paenibacillus alvei]
MIANEARERLLKLLGPERYRDDKESLVTHSYDATPMMQSLPDAVVYPESTADVQEILRTANEYRIPIVPRGAASNLCGGTVPVAGGIVVAMTRMNKLIEMDTENLTATFQPGLNTKTFHREVEKRGLFYPPDPSSMSISTLGGNIMEGAGGLRGLKYGTTKDYVIALEAVLPSGEVIRTGGKLYKDVAGYDLTKLLVGSEGTLALITEATVKLLPAPGIRKTMLVSYKDIYAAARSVSRIVGAGIIPATLEFMDQPTIRVVEEYNHIGLPTDMQAVLLIEQDGQDENVVMRDMEAIAKICNEDGADSVQTAKDEMEAEQLMKARRSALSTLARIRPTTILEDATVPRSKIAEMVLAINRIAEQYGVNICTFGHAGDGNLHPTCPTDARIEDEIHRVEQAFADIFEEAIRLGGTITGEHGVGTVKAPYLEWKVGPAGIDIMKGIKQVFDPNGIMNPGKIFAKAARKRLVVSR